MNPGSERALNQGKRVNEELVPADRGGHNDPHPFDTLTLQAKLENRPTTPLIEQAHYRMRFPMNREIPLVTQVVIENMVTLDSPKANGW